MKIRYKYGNEPVEAKIDKKKQKSKYYMGKSNARAVINFGKQLAKQASWENLRLSIFLYKLPLILNDYHYNLLINIFAYQKTKKTKSTVKVISYKGHKGYVVCSFLATPSDSLLKSESTATGSHLLPTPIQ